MVMSVQPVFAKPLLDALLTELCIKLGFCLQGAAAESFYASTPATAEAFTNAVFVAEGISLPVADESLYKKVLSIVASTFVAQQGIQADGSA